MLRYSATVALLWCVTTISWSSAATHAVVNVSRVGRQLDGIGGLSGGGATSVLLWTYPEPQRSEILDFLFKPNFGASLHILKVEIGGDAQSTDGAEPSHMHTPWDENYQRGYEWWLMLEAKKRNPQIKLYGLSWAFPQWVTCAPDSMENCTDNIYAYPEVTAGYIVKWISGAKTTYGLDIDYVGCWNERPFNDTYLKTLRAALDSAGFSSTKIVAPDGSWDIANDILADPVLAKAVHAIGAHYPGTVSTAAAEATEKPLWASEDDSTYNNDIGAGCWARIINQNYVNGNMTASINWNLVAAYMKGTNWYRAGLMNAMQPWVGSYGSWHADGTWTAGPMIWATAHTTQFTEPEAWQYLQHGFGSGLLSSGGSFVTMVNSQSRDLTIVIEKMSYDHSFCVRPGLAKFNTSNETISLEIVGVDSAWNITELHVWFTHWAYDSGDRTVEFEYLGTTNVVDGVVTVEATVNSMYTLTTVATGVKGAPRSIPQQPSLFPPAFEDDFESCRISGEAKYFSDQNGVFECVDSNDEAHGVVMEQMVPMRPVTWGGDIRPHSLIGHRDAKNTSLAIDGYMPNMNGSILLGVRMQGTDNSNGILWSIDTSNQWAIWRQVSDVGGDFPLATGVVDQPILPGVWNRYRIDVNGSALRVWVNGVLVVPYVNVSGMTQSGHALIGTVRYGQSTRYDNIELYSAYTHPSASTAQAGDALCVVECNSEVGLVATSQWTYNGAPNAGGPGSLVSLRNQPWLCLAATPTVSSGGAWWLTVAPCNISDAHQLWSWSFSGIAPDAERVSFMYLPASSRCLDIYNTHPDIGAPMDAWECNFGTNQAFFYDHDAGEIANEAASTCVGVCHTLEP